MSKNIFLKNKCFELHLLPIATSICFYHSERQAINKCRRCNRLICLEDAAIKNNTKNMETSDKSNNVSNQKILCPLCELTRKINQIQNIKSPTGLILIGIFTIFPFIIGIITSGNGLTTLNTALNPPQTIFSVQRLPEYIYFLAFLSLLFIIVGLFVSLTIPFLIIRRVIVTMKQSSVKIEELIDQKRLFIESITSKEAKKQINQDKLSDTTMTCFQCGTTIFQQEKFCSNCGKSKKDELFSAFI